MRVTAEFLKEKMACTEGYRYVSEKKWLGLNDVEFIKNLMADKKYDWANWLIVRVMEKKQYLAYAIFAAEQVYPLWAKKYPKEAATWRNWVDDGCPASAARAAYAAYAASSTDATRAAYAAADAASSTDATRAAACATRAAACAAYAAADAARATYATRAAAKEEMQIKILNYGLSLLESTK